MQKSCCKSVVPECGNCGASDVPLLVCARCTLVNYCSKQCQVQHWKSKTGHKTFCLTKDERRPPEDIQKKQDKCDECPICLSEITSISAICTLPCSHSFHVECVDGLRRLCLAQVCPMCRAELPDGAEKLFDEGVRRYCKIMRKVDRGELFWNKLDDKARTEMSEVIHILTLSSNLGHMGACNNLGSIYAKGQGVKTNYAEAVKWCRKAADRGLADAQFNMGVAFERGEGVEKDELESIRWYQLAAEQGDRQAETNLGSCYANGMGVDQNFLQARLWWQKSALKGDPEAMFNLAMLDLHGHGMNKKNLPQGTLWLKKAAGLGLARAQFYLVELSDHLKVKALDERLN